MIILELALQGIAGFAPLTRISAKPGINVGKSSEVAQRRAILDAIYHTMYPDPARAGATERLADRNAKESRIALTFFGRDKETYRVVREAVNGAVSLHKFDKETKKYNALSRVAQEVAQYLRVNQQIPDEVGFERLFILSPETMPSKGVRAKTRSGSGLASTADLPSGPGRPAMPRAQSLRPLSRAQSGFGSALNPMNALVQAELAAPEGMRSKSDRDDPADEPSDDYELKREQLAKLREEMISASRAEHAQVELDALNARRFELSQKAERAKELREEVEKLQRLAESQADLHNLPPGFGERLRRLEEMQTKYQQDRGKLAEEREAIEGQIRSAIVVPLQEDRYFIASMLFAVMFVTAAITFQKPAIALLNIPCVTIAAAAAFRYVAELEKKTRTALKLTTVADRETRLERQYDLDTAALRRLMEKLEISDPRDLLERIEGAEQVEKQLRSAEHALASFRSDPVVVLAERELDQIVKRVETLEAEVIGAQGLISAATLSVRISQLEREITAVEQKRGLALTVRRTPVPLPRAPTPMINLPPPDLPRLSTGDVPRVITGDLVRAGSNIYPAFDPSQRSVSYPMVDPTRPMEPLPTVQPRAATQRSAPPRSVSAVLPPTKEAASLFDFGGGNIGHDDEDDEGRGYSSGYSGGSAKKPGNDGGSSTSGSHDGEGYFAASSFPGSGGSGIAGGYGGGGGDDDGDMLAPDRSRDLMQAAVDLLQVDVDGLGLKIEKRLSQYLEAFTDGKFKKPEFGPRGEVSLIARGKEESIAYVSLEGADLDLVDSALRFTLIEACLVKVRVPILIDDPYGAFPTKKRMLLSQMIGYLGKATQIVMLTDKADVTGNPLTF